MATLYLIYAVGAYFTLGPDTPFAYRIVMIFGMATFPLPLLVAPAVYLAALDHFDLYAAISRRTRKSHWGILAVVALGTYVVCAAGPAVFDRALEAVAETRLDQPREGIVVDGHARITAPVAVGLFVFVAAVFGAVVGHATMGLDRVGRFCLRWVAGVVAIATFYATLVGVDELITMHGELSPLWLAVAPPGVPLLFTLVLARNDLSRIVDSVNWRLRFWKPTMDATALDELVTTTIAAEEASSADDETSMQGARPELAALVSGLRQGSTDRIAIHQEHGRRIVSEIAAGAFVPATPSTVGDQTAMRWVPVAAAFVGAWVCLSVGLLLLGGAAIGTPSVVSAVVAGLVGAGASVFLSRRDLMPTPATMATG
ncbi:MAG: hypothetical protein OXT72_06310 [Gammaproteobacteria bacterium]|nr:hypothetical protein [Gammaproteobacteria bacterium]MDE2875040.1 hypothetical protein [Gemmatimonadota bacterium]